MIYRLSMANNCDWFAARNICDFEDIAKFLTCESCLTLLWHIYINGLNSLFLKKTDCDSLGWNLHHPVLTSLSISRNSDR